MIDFAFISMPRLFFFDALTDDFISCFLRHFLPCRDYFAYFAEPFRVIFFFFRAARYDISGR